MPPLDFDAFRRAIKKGEILPAYYLHGDVDLLKDDGLRDLLAAALDPSTRDFNLEVRRGSEIRPGWESMAQAISTSRATTRTRSRSRRHVTRQSPALE